MKLAGNWQETGNIRSIYDNGVILASAPDENAAEEAVHYALLEHPAPRHLLLIGGGVNGSIAQALKHPTVERIDYVELDPALIDMARQFFPAQSAPVVSDPRVHMHYADGRYYLKTAGGTFDVIILNVPDPQTAQLNRFYTAEFFRSARDHLASGGLLALQLRSSEDYISPDLAEFLRCIHHTLRQVFPYVVAIPGETIHFFAATRPDVLTDNPQTLIARLQERNLKTQYVREYFIPFRMMPDRMEQVREQLRPLASTPVNRDFEPIAYYFDVVLWSTQFKLGYSRWFRAAAHIAFTSVIDAVLVVLLFVAVLLAFVPAREKRARSAAACCDGCDRIYADGSADFPAAGIPVRLRLRLPPTRDPHRHVHGRHCLRKLAGHPPHSFQRSSTLPHHGNHPVPARPFWSCADICG